MKWPTGDEVIRIARREHGATVMLAFSAGKDSIAAWLKMRGHFDRIIPVYKYLIPNLEFMEESLQYYERFFATPIVRIPHNALYRMLGACVFQPPGRWETLVDHVFPKHLDHNLWTRQTVTDTLKLPPNIYTAIGTRLADSPARRMNFIRRGPFNTKALTFCPVWDMTKAELVRLLRTIGCKLPMEYRIFGRSFDGIDFRFLYGIKRYFPRDYERILEWFPLAHLEIRRYERKKEKERAGC